MDFTALSTYYINILFECRKDILKVKGLYKKRFVDKAVLLKSSNIILYNNIAELIKC